MSPFSSLTPSLPPFLPHCLPYSLPPFLPPSSLFLPPTLPPSLVQYLAPVLSGTSALLHTRTFLLVRISHLLFLVDRAWTVSELSIATLHCMAREIKLLKVNPPSLHPYLPMYLSLPPSLPIYLSLPPSLQLTLPVEAFNCWAYMTCNEAILAIMTQISADSLMSATTSSASSLLLVRAELWHYALQKASHVTFYQVT